ncbi:MAG: DUF6569 family protein, partial [Planctomycetota bacterium]|nr:DUF6569 family protein [Planctomycetota bacterium]
VADARTGKVIGLELFGRRDLFDGLQEKLVEGYAADLVLTVADWDPKRGKGVAEKAIKAFIRRTLKGTSGYEDTPGSGRGIGITSGSLCGKGVALGGDAIHLSVQDTRPKTTPARPIVTPPRPVPRPVPRPIPRPVPEPARPRVQSMR